MFYYLKKLLKYILTKNEYRKLKIEHIKKLSSNEIYDLNKPTYIKGIWVLSEKEFFIFKPDLNKFSPIHNTIMEICVNVKCTDIPYIESEHFDFLITKPCNLFTFDQVKMEYIPYRKKIKICI